MSIPKYHIFVLVETLRTWSYIPSSKQTSNHGTEEMQLIAQNTAGMYRQPTQLLKVKKKHVLFWSLMMIGGLWLLSGFLTQFENCFMFTLQQSRYQRFQLKGESYDLTA